jgi:hypothetical protein
MKIGIIDTGGKGANRGEYRNAGDVLGVKLVSPDYGREKRELAAAMTTLNEMRMETKHEGLAARLDQLIEYTSIELCEAQDRYNDRS